MLTLFPSQITRSRTFGRSLLAVMCLAFVPGCSDSSEPQNTASSRPVRYRVTPEASAAAAVLVRTGEIRAHDELLLSFQLPGRLASRNVDVGDTIVPGKLLATLESEDARNGLRSAEAELDSARATEQEALTNLQRFQRLVTSGAMARIQLDSAQAGAQAARSRRQSAEAALNHAQDTMKRTRLIAHQTGIVIAAHGVSGQVVEAGQPILTVATQQGWDAVFDVTDPHVIAQLRDTPFKVALVSDPTITVQGHLRDVSPQANALTRTWRVRVTLENPPKAMALGASVQASITSAEPPTISLPASALTQKDNRPAVLVIDEHHQLRLRTVTLDHYTANEMLVREGLRQGEKVVIAGVHRLREGDEVTLGEEKK